LPNEDNGSVVVGTNNTNATSKHGIGNNCFLNSPSESQLCIIRQT
jgi:hypothetical protein